VDSFLEGALPSWFQLNEDRFTGRDYEAATAEAEEAHWTPHALSSHLRHRIGYARTSVSIGFGLPASIACCLVLHLRVEFGANQVYDGRDPDPGHEANYRPQRAVRLIECPKLEA
jgi:hypothetical protein